MERPMEIVDPGVGSAVCKPFLLVRAGKTPVISSVMKLPMPSESRIGVPTDSSAVEPAVPRATTSFDPEELVTVQPVFETDNCAWTGRRNDAGTMTSASEALPIVNVLSTRSTVVDQPPNRKSN